MVVSISAYERYPTRTVLLSNAQTISTWAIGAYLVWAALGMVFALLFVIYCVVIELNLLRRSCVNCYYYGKICFSGRGRCSSALFRKGDPDVFVGRDITWVDMLPDILVSVIPITCGIGVMIVDFSWLVLALLLALVGLTTMGNALVRGRLACKYCRQRTLGCPA
ncbi:MAG: hypothetical protein WBD03_06290, partial [Thermoplasmata archaeon]